MEKLSAIEKRAAKRKGGAKALEAELPAPKSKASLSRIKDDHCLSRMTQFVFSAGFVWKVIENKWEGFEAAFHGFDVATAAAMGARELGELKKDTRIVRNGPKIETVRDNARYILGVAADHRSFGRFLSSWPDDDFVGLWNHLKENGSRLGGFTGPMFLRHVGKDTPMMTGDVIKALIEQDIVTKKPTSKRDLAAVQAAFNTWRDQSSRPLCQISKILACSVD